MLGAFERGLIAVLLLVLMLGMGATLQVNNFRAVRRRPAAVLIGVGSQFGWMPLIAYALARGLSLPADAAVMLVLVGCSPGGTTSNMFTYFARGDVALSICMTSISTLVALVAMPMLLWGYATPFTTADLTIPYGSIVQTLMFLLLPVGLGMWVRRRSLTLAQRLERAGSLAGALVVVLLTASVCLREGEALSAVAPGAQWAASGLGALGMALGYAGAALTGLSGPARRAVLFETGVQNTALSLAIVATSFRGPPVAAMVPVALIYALSTTLLAGFATTGFRYAGATEQTSEPVKMSSV